MSLRFSRDHIERWARFSGDFNPIHFDETAAGRLGIQGVVVHGMLALLAVKQGVAEHAAKLDAPWTEVRSMLRNPVPEGAPQRLSTSPTRSGARFTLADEASGAVTIKGSLRADRTKLFSYLLTSH